MEAHKNGTQPLWASEKPTVKLSSSYFRRFQVGPNLIQNLGQAPEEPNPWIQNLQIGRINLCTNTLHITTTIIYIPNSSPVWDWKRVIGLRQSTGCFCIPGGVCGAVLKPILSWPSLGSIHGLLMLLTGIVLQVLI